MKKDIAKRSKDVKAKMVQVQNPRTKKWVKINTQTGVIVAHKKTVGPYKNVEKKEQGNGSNN